MQQDLKLNRRGFLMGTTAAALLGCGPVGARTQHYSEATVTPRPLSSAFPFRVGVCVQSPDLLGTPHFRGLVSEHFNQVSTGYEAQMTEVMREGGRNDYTGVDIIANTADAEDDWLHMHALLWHETVPKRLRDLAHDPDAFAAETWRHLDAMMARYKAQAKSWDVVNEPIENNTGKMRTDSSLFTQVLGPDYVKYALERAHKADPTAQLFVNEYALESDPAKLEGYLKLIEDVQKSGAPLHGVGTQMHIDIYSDPSDIRKSLQALVETGLKVHISELDISVNPKRRHPFDITEGHLQHQAHLMHEVFAIYPQVVPTAQQFAITIWGVMDHIHWMLVHPYHMRKDAPVLFRQDGSAKPAFYGVLAAATG